MLLEYSLALSIIDFEELSRRGVNVSNFCFARMIKFSASFFRAFIGDPVLDLSILTVVIIFPFGFNIRN